MPRDGNGTYSLPAGNPVVTGTTISSVVDNNTMNDIATALTDSLTKTGQTVPTANIPLGGFKITNLGNGSAATDAASIGQTVNALAASSGSSLVGFIQSGTGAVARTTQAKERDWVSVLDFAANGVSGAAVDPTGVVDSALGIQAAITSLTNGGVVYFPPGLYKMGSQIVIPQNIPIILYGSGISHQALGVSTGTELRSTLRDGVSPAIKVIPAAADFSLFSMENLYLSGGTYTEVTGGPGQGGAALGNFVGLSIKNRLRWQMRNVRIAGFDTDNLRLDTNAYYGAAYNCSFMWGGTGVNSIDGGNVEGFYNCHFQYNVFGTVNVRNTFGCAWEGQWKSGQKYNILGIEGRHVTPYFETNNGSNTAGEADIWVDTTSYAAAISLESPYFSSGSAYSAKGVATYCFTGKCLRLILSGAMRVINATPQNYALFNLVGSSGMYDYTGHPGNFTNYVAFTAAAGQYFRIPDGYYEFVLATSTLTHFGNNSIRLTAGGAINLDNISDGYFGQKVMLMLADANITIRHLGGGSGNLRLAGGVNFVSSVRDVMVFTYDPNGATWNEVSRAANN